MAGTDQKIIEVIIKGQQPNASINQITSAAKILNAEMKKLPQNTAEFKQKAEELKSVNARLKSIREDINGIKPAFQGAAKETSSWGETLKGVLGAGIIERGVEMFKDFLKESVKAFVDAQKNAHDLEFALKNIAGESGNSALERLLKQSEELQKKGIFSDDDIQKSQTAQVQYGLTAKQVESLTPKILDLAAAQGIDLASATDKVLSAVGGQTKGLKLAGIAFEDTGDKVKNLALLTDKLTKFQGANEASLDTIAGKTKRLANVFDDLQESIGGLLVNQGTQILDFFDLLSGGFDKTFNKLGLSELQKNINASNKLTLEEAGKSESDRLRLIAESNKRIIEFSREVQVAKTDIQRKGAKELLDSEIALQEQLRNLNETKGMSDSRTVKGLQMEQAANEKILAAHKKLLDDLDKIEFEFSQKGLSEEDKRIFAIHDKYKKLLELAKGNKDDVMRVQKDYAKELNDATGTMHSDLFDQHNKYADTMVAKTADFGKRTTAEYQYSFAEKIELAQKFYQKYQDAFSKFTSIIEEIVAQSAEKEKRKIEDKEKANDAELKTENENDKKLLDNKIINKAEYDKRVIENQQKHDAKERKLKKEAAKADKKAKENQAEIEFIASSISTLASAPYPYNLVLEALNALEFGLQMSALENAPDAYAAGGYNLKKSNKPEGFTTGPTLYSGSASGKSFIAGEDGKEWISPSWMVEDPQTGRIIEQLENIRQNRSYASGGSNGSPIVNGASQSSGGNFADQLSSTLNQLNSILGIISQNGVTAHLDYDNFIRSQSRIDQASKASQIG